MALTKVGSIGIATGISLTGVTTTQDAKVGTGITLSPDGHGYYTGIVTATSYRGDVSNCTGVGQTNFIDAESLNVSGISTFTGQATVGTGITLSPDGDVFFTGVVTATSYAGDGSALTGIAATDNVRTGILDVAGVGTFRDNINVADRIIHVGDTNTQIRFPTADTVTVETGGTERIRVDSSGRLLIGTTDTDSVSDGEVPKLIIKATDSTAGASLVRYSANSSGTGIFFGKSRNATVGSNTIVQSGDELGRITFSGDDGTNINTMGARIQAFVDGTPGENDMPGRLTFSTTADGAASPTERLRIDSSGNVMIGRSDGSKIFSLRETDTTTGVHIVQTIGGASHVASYAVGLGFDTEGYAARNKIAIVAEGTGSGYSRGKLHFLLDSANDSGEATLSESRMTILDSGNVGINDASPSNQLIVKAPGGSGHSCAKVVSGDGNQLLTMQVIQGAEARLGTDSGAPLALYSNGNEFARLQTTGQLTLGTTTDVAPDGFASKIQVNASNHEGSIQVGRHTANANGPALLFLKTRSGSATPGTGVVADDDNLGTIRFFGSDGTDTASSAAQIQCHVDASAGTNDMPGRLTFGTTPDGESSPKESMRIDSYGSLIQSGGHCSGAQMDSYTPGSASMPKFFQSDGGTNTKSGDVWTTVLNVGTSHPTWDLFSIKGSTNFGIWVEVTCYFSQITSGTYGRQKVAYRVQRNGNADFGTGVTNPYDKAENNNDKFIPTISTSGSGSSMRATFRIQGTGLTNYCQTMYHIRWVCGDNGAEPIVYY